MLTASDQGQSYAEVFRKFERGGRRPEPAPDIVYLENTQLQVLADSGLSCRPSHAWRSTATR